MSRKKSKTAILPESEKVQTNREVNQSPVFYWKEYLLISMLAFISFGASVMNEYALDDFIVLVKNQYVQRGFAGISNIFTKDTFAGMTDINVMVLSGGRYRPFSLFTFAIEHQLIGNNAAFSHFLNVLLLALSGIVLYQVLKKMMGSNPIALCTAAVFVVLPIHSEAIINIKGRDDILCFLFFLLALRSLFHYLDTSKIGQLAFSFVGFFLSLLSKETAVTFVLVFPLVMYFFSTKSLSQLGKIALPYFFITLVFVWLRYLATKDNGAVPTNDLFNNPFILMNQEQHYATILLTWLIYLKLIFFPIHLSYDYNFNQIPATDFGDVRVWVSLMVYLSIVLVAFFYFKRKSIYSFALLFFLLTFSILSNLFFNIGAPVAERFMYIPSLGICIVMVCLLFDAGRILESKKLLKNSRSFSYVVIGVILVLSCIRNTARCSDWKNNQSLFIADVKSVPNNSKANMNAGLSFLLQVPKSDSLLKPQLLDSAMKYYSKGIEIYPGQIDSYLNIGVIYNWRQNYDSAEFWWNRARAINPSNSTLREYDKVLSTYFFQQGLKKGLLKEFDSSIKLMLHALKYDSLSSSINYNLGGAYFTIQDFKNAEKYWSKTLSIDPGNQGAQSGMMGLKRQAEQKK